MKQNETLLETGRNNIALMDTDDLFEEQSAKRCYDTPLRMDAFDITDEEKIAAIAHHFGEIMDVLGLDLDDDSLNGTPERVAKMFVKEVFSGLNPVNKPEIRLFENKYQYNEMLIEKDINLYSYCEHHFVSIIARRRKRCLYIKWDRDRLIKDQQAGTILCETPAGTGTADQPDCRRFKRSPANRRYRCYY